MIVCPSYFKKLQVALSLFTKYTFMQELKEIKLHKKNIYIYFLGEKCNFLIEMKSNSTADAEKNLQ